MNPIFATLPTTIFETMSRRSAALGAINLGQGFPDGQGPPDLLRAAADALLHRSNQYPPMTGLPELRQAIATHYDRHQGLAFDWQEEVIVTSGATEAIAASIMALVRPGDEVVLVQPLYDAYLPLVRQAGGVPRLVSLRPPEWRLTRAQLDAVFSDKVRLLILNNPLNPAAKLFTAGELALIAEYCVRHDALAISDEVWEHVVFDGGVHLPLIAQPGMRERTVKIGSAGKIFSLTGWKVGWACAAPELARTIARAHQFLTFTTPPNLQWAVAQGLAKEERYFSEMRAGYARSRDRLAAGLQAAGFATLPSAGTYFLLVDLPGSGIGEGDDAFAERLLTEVGVGSIPVSAFYAEAPVRSVLRFCFSKLDDVLDEAIDRMARARDRLTA